MMMRKTVLDISKKAFEEKLVLPQVVSRMRTMLINTKRCICLALTSTTQNVNSEQKLYDLKVEVCRKHIHIQLNRSSTLRASIVSFHHGGHSGEHSRRRTWLLTEQSFSVALSVLCSLCVTRQWCE